jgi:hypothetical protein
MIVKKLLQYRYKINYIFPAENSSQRIINDRIEYFDFKVSDYINIKDPLFVNNPMSLKFWHKYPQYLYYIKYTLKKLMDRALKGSSYLLMHYPATSIISLVKAALDTDINRGVFWVYPQYPNETYPPMMSTSIKNIKFTDDDKSIETKTFYNVLNTTYLESGYKIYDIFLKDCDTFVMIEKLLLPAPVNVYSANAIQLGGMVSHEITKSKNKELVAFVKNKNLIYISFGSYDLKIFDKTVIQKLINLGYSILHHHGNIEGNFPGNRYMVYKDFISHEWLIPKCSYVFSSGSLCMTTIANYHGVPIIYFPILTEQLFWAKLYYKRTGIPYVYIPPNSKSIPAVCPTIMKSLSRSKKIEATSFIKKLSLAMKKNSRPVDMLVKNVIKNIQKNKSRPRRGLKKGFIARLVGALLYKKRSRPSLQNA